MVSGGSRANFWPRDVRLQRLELDAIFGQVCYLALLSVLRIHSRTKHR